MRMVCSGEVIEVGNDPDNKGRGYAVFSLDSGQGNIRLRVSKEEAERLVGILHEPMSISVEFNSPSESYEPGRRLDQAPTASVGWRNR